MRPMTSVRDRLGAGRTGRRQERAEWRVRRGWGSRGVSFSSLGSTCAMLARTTRAVILAPYTAQWRLIGAKIRGSFDERDENENTDAEGGGGGGGTKRE